MHPALQSVVVGSLWIALVGVLAFSAGIVIRMNSAPGSDKPDANVHTMSVGVAVVGIWCLGSAVLMASIAMSLNLIDRFLL